MPDKAKQLGELLLKKNRVMVTAESCTGGLIAKRMTDIPGSSAWFDRGFVTYSNASKHDMLGVPNELLQEYGAVSEPVVRAMTKGALEHSLADVAVAVSGIAGPGGGTPNKPVGMVCFSFQLKDSPSESITRDFHGSREAIRQAAADYALEQLSRIMR